MTKKELSNEVAKQHGVLSPAEVEKVLEMTINVVKESVKIGDPVTLRGFGTFSTKTRKAKRARNIKAGTEVMVPEHKIPFFKPSPEFKALVN